jgi:hypothetical protein
MMSGFSPPQDALLWSGAAVGIIAAFGAAAKVLAWLRARARELIGICRELAAHIRALHEIAEAQLTQNHGTSIVDKVRLIPNIQTLVAEQGLAQMADRKAAEERHAIAEKHWEGLERADAGFQDKLDTLESIIKFRGTVVEAFIKTRSPEEQERYRLFLEALVQERGAD